MTKNKWETILPIIMLTLAICSNVKADTVTERIWGNDRYDTAIEVSKNGWKDGSEYVVLASGENFPDALSSAPLAKKYNAPVLLNYGPNLDERVKTELKRLGAKQVIIIGGLGVVPSTVKAQIENLNITTERLSGQDRYETAVKVAEKIDFKGSLFLVNGENFPDAVSVSAVAAQNSAPILLTPHNDLPQVVEKYIKDREATNVYVIGQEDVISKNVANKLPSISERIEGNDKYDTNIAVLDKFKNMIGHNSIYIASGKNFPDALAGSALAAKNSSSIILLDEISGKTTKDYISKEMENVSKVNVLGGTGSITNELLQSVISSNKTDTISEDKELGDKIYYINELDNNEIYKKDKDGSNITKVRDERVEQLIPYNGWLYFLNDKGIYRIRKDNSNIQCITEDLSWLTNFKISQDYVYYGNCKGVYKVKIDGSEMERIVDIDKLKFQFKGVKYIEDLDIIEDSIYFKCYLQTEGEDVFTNKYKVKMDGSGLEVVLN